MNQERDFPEGFLWGTAMSGHQNEGDSQDSWTAAEPSGKLPKAGIANDFYHCYDGDFDTARELHSNAIRFSVEMSRICPKAGETNRDEIDHAKKVIESAHAHGLSPILTFHHFTHPVWFEQRGAWQKRENVRHFLGFVDTCGKNFGKSVPIGVVINEPNVYAGASYLKGIWPPFEKNPLGALRAYINMAKAHNEAYPILHDANPDMKVGSAIHMVDIHALSPLDRILRYVFNHSFLNLTKENTDYIGVNYYKPWYFPRTKDRTANHADNRWPVSAQGLYSVLVNTWQKYRLPMLVTENGIADTSDLKRQRFVVDHLHAVSRAIRNGVDIKGYMHWTLMDNYELADGYAYKFGLCSVDRQTLERTPRESARIYAEICRTGTLPK